MKEEDCVNIFSLNTERYLDISIENVKIIILIKESPMRAAETKRETKVLSRGSVVIFRFECFPHSYSIAIRSPCIVDCSDNLTLPISPSLDNSISSLDNSICVSFRNKYSLVATINHSGVDTSLR